MSVSKSTFARLGVVLAGTSLVLTGCLSAGGDDTGGETGGGDPIEIVGAFSGTQQEGFEADIAKISEETGIAIEYVSTDQFEVLIQSRVEGGNVPDIAIYPQPGLLLDMVGSGDIVALDDAGVDVEGILAGALPGLSDTVTQDGTVYGLPYSFNAKSLVWYPSPEFEDAGYTDPTTHDELVALSDQIKADGTTPWCFGVDVGWPGTDWLEEYVLRVGGPEVYDQWVSHEIPFNDPIIKEAAEKVGELLLADGNVYGGLDGVAATTFDVAANPLFDETPGCYLHRQGNFITSFFPEDVQADLTANTNLFLLPPVEGGFDGQPILGGGDFMALFSADNADAATVLAAIASPDFGANSAQSGAWLSPYVEFDTSQYANETLTQIADLATTADTFRFDGSDSMPGEVGNGTFWTGMVEWLSGQKDLDTVLDEIEASWPAS